MSNDRYAKTWLITIIVFWASVFLFAITANGENPGKELTLVKNHLQSIPVDRRPYVRYLTLYNIPEDQRPDVVTSVTYLLNSLSSSPVLTSPEFVAQSNDDILFFDLRQYATKQVDYNRWSLAWDDMVGKDPYFHLGVEVLADGETRSPATINAPWLDRGIAKQLQVTTRSAGPLLRADYFVAKASTAVNGFYYRFLGVPQNLKDWYKMLSIRLDSVPHAHGASINISGVTHNPRRIIRLQGPIGGLYLTNDQGNITADQDPVRNPIDRDGSIFLKGVYSEHIAFAPNDLLWYSIYSPEGQRADFAPDFVAKDSSDSEDTGILRPMISCVRCHIESGLRPFEDDFSRLMKLGANFASADPLLLQTAAGFYDQRVLQREVGIDRGRYEDALQSLVGMTHKDLIQRFSAVYRRFALNPVTKDVAATELGTTPDRLTQSLQNNPDPIIITLVTGRPVVRAQWESSFSAAAMAVWQQDAKK